MKPFSPSTSAGNAPPSEVTIVRAAKLSTPVGRHCFQQTLNKPLSIAIDHAASIAWTMPGKVLWPGRRARYVQQGNVVNASGDPVLDTDLDARLHVTERTNAAGHACITEEDEQVGLPDSSSFRYAIAWDPLDGSSGSRCGVPALGMFAGIYEWNPNHWSGKNLVASLMLTIGREREMHVATRKGGTWAFGEADFATDTAAQLPFPGNQVHIRPKAEYLHLGATLKKCPAEMLKHLVALDLSHAYKRCLADDVNFMLQVSSGSIFVYPKARLRVLYELLPVALLVTEARGAAYLLDEKNYVARTLDEVIVPSNTPHATASVIFGSKHTVEELLTACGYVIAG